jgi:transcriptional regulator with XRE-family HTH domain
MAPKELLPLIQQLKRWREIQGLSQSKAVRALNEAGIPVTLYSLQSWEIGRWNPRAPVALALAEFLQKQRRRGHRKRSRSTKKDDVDQ